MLYTLNPSLAQNLRWRLLAILGVALLTGIFAQLSIPTQPVPFTFQVLAVLLAGLTLGWRDGALSQATYLGLIAMGAPLAANGVGGWAAFNSPTTGYLLSFPLAAAVTGALAVRPVLAVRWLAGVVGVVVVYLCGATWLKQYLGLSWSATWEAGVEPFIPFDMAKALLAAASGEGARWLRRAFLPPQQD